MRVLLISHTCQSRVEGHGRAGALAAMPDIELLVLSPARWFDYGRWRDAQTPIDDAFRMRIERVSLPWVGPAQFYLHWYPRLRRIIEEFKPDIIDLWEEPWAVVSLQACLLRDRIANNAKVLIETEQNILRTLPPPFEQIRRRVLREADFVVGRNSEAVSVTRRKGYTGPACVVGNALDEKVFRPMDKIPCKKFMEIDPRAFVAGYVGRLVEEKGVMDLIEATAACPENVECVLVGSGPMADDLTRRAASLGISRRVHLVGSKSIAELPEIMNAFDTLVLMSRTTRTWKEQFGRVIIEANACGVPVIGSDSGAIPSVIGEAGLVVREGDVPALAAAIGKLQSNPGLADRLGRAGRLQVEQNYGWTSQAERYAAIFRGMMAESIPDYTTHTALSS